MRLKLYFDLNKNTYKLEVWGGSTKAPDCVFDMYQDVDNGVFTPSIMGESVSLFQWLLYCASTMSLPHASVEIVELAMLVHEVI